ncbi:MAG: hypothetical protein QXJ12_00450 [Candidatus Parvarchaeota archaeon]|nr:hypothetical protein [Candidatus Parvarchaeota archaeon]
MGLERIIEKIEKESKEKASDIVKEANLAAEKIINESKAKAAAILKQTEAKASLISKELEQTGDSKVNIEMDMITKKSISSAFDDSLAVLRKSAAEIKHDNIYKELIPKLLISVKKSLGNDAVIYMDKEDSITFKKLSQNIKVSPKSTGGGLYAVSGDGRRSIDLTMDKLIDAVKDRIGEKVMRRIRA